MYCFNAAAAATDLTELVAQVHDQVQADPEKLAAVYRKQFGGLTASLTADDDGTELDLAGITGLMAEVMECVKATLHAAHKSC